MKYLVFAIAILLALPVYAEEAPQPEANADDAAAKMWLDVTEKYQDIFFRLRKNPADRTAMLEAPLVIDPTSDEHRKAVEQIITLTAAAAEKNPKDFFVAQNYYLALWHKYLHYKNVDDAKAAFAQADKAISVAGKKDRAIVAFHKAQNSLVLAQNKDEQGNTHLQIVLQKGADEAALELFTAAKRAAMSKGYIAAHSAVILGEIYRKQGKIEDARKMIREALDSDSTNGLVMNRALSQMGLILIEDGNLDGAIDLLQKSLNLKYDESLRANGYAYELAAGLIEKDKCAEAVAYLAKVVKMADEGKIPVNFEVMYWLAKGYMGIPELDKSQLYWQRCVELGNVDPARLKEAKRFAIELARPQAEE